GAEQPEQVREGQDLLDEPAPLDVLALRHELEVPRNVDVGRAAHLTRRHAVRVVVAQDVLEVLPSELEERVRRLRDLHACLDGQMARWHRPVIALDLDKAHAARGGRSELLVIAERRDLESRALCGSQYGFAGNRSDLFAVNP